MAEIKLTEREQGRYDIIRACIDRDITNQEATSRLGLKVRQVQRLKRAVEQNDKQGIGHKAKGQVSSNATNFRIVKKVLAFLKQKKHHDFGPTFAQEKLVARGVKISIETTRSIMVKHKLWQVKPRRGPQVIRVWRERKQRFGELVQFDGSYHDWLETGGEQCLLAAIDDATSQIVQMTFEANEGVLAVFRFWLAYVEAHGRPVAIYLDKFSTYKVNHKNAVDNTELMTQFGRAMKELDILVICANSPEAKGRVERLFGTLQDRLVKELRLARVETTDQANRFLDQIYLADHNQRFSVPPQELKDAHRALTAELRLRLPAIFSICAKRKVNNDYTIQFKIKWFQLAIVQKTTVYKRDEVMVEERLDGTIHIRLKDIYLDYHQLPERPKPRPVPVVALTGKKPSWRPPLDHPWRRISW